jgi:hypothetical protein
MGAAGAAGADVAYIDDMFSTWLYTGNGSTQTITNGIDLATEGGLVWIKDRTIGLNHALFDTARGTTQMLQTDNTGAQAAQPNAVNAFNSNGFTSGSNVYTNNNNTPYASWTFRKQPKFFDVVTYTGDGTSNRNIAHSLGSAPGCVIIKRTDSIGQWPVWHRSITQQNSWAMFLSATNGQSDQGVNLWGSPTSGTPNMNSSTFSVGDFTWVNESGATYVAYLFAHDAGGFGTAGTDNVISCGSYTGNGTQDGSKFINLGFEPQWVLVKNASGSTDWVIADIMRGTTDSSSNILTPNTSGAEFNTTPGAVVPRATGFEVRNNSSYYNGNDSTYIYIAIRRPMKPPTTGTEVFNARAVTEAMNANTVNLGITSDLVIAKPGRSVSMTNFVVDRLRGMPISLELPPTGAEINNGSGTFGAGQTSVTWAPIANSTNIIQWIFKRASGFFDVVCYTGTGSAATFNHNLGVAPEFIIVKNRGASQNWRCYHSALTASDGIALNLDLPTATSSTYWNSTSPTSSVFSVGTSAQTNSSGNTYVAYLFATVAGVSKVGSYTGTGTTNAINCGFSGGARFVMIKRTDDTGDWFVWDTARGIVSGNDPYLLMNSSAAEVTSTDYIDPSSAGFEISSSAPAAINASGGTYLFLAIA